MIEGMETVGTDMIERTVRILGEQQPWNHNFELPHGVQTRPGVQVSQGKNLVKLARLQPILDDIDLAQKTVLDVGCNEGFFSIHMAKAGAQVLGIDIDEKRIAKARFVKEILGLGNEVTFNVMDIYSDEFKSLRRFDLCLCLGFIHRVPDPFRALAALADRSDTIIFEWKALKFGPHDDAFAYFSPKEIDEVDFYGTEYWLLSYAAVERIMRRCGFRHFHRIDDPRQRRAILVAGRNYHAVFARPDVVVHRGRMRSLASHSKRFLRTAAGIIMGRVNA